MENLNLNLNATLNGAQKQYIGAEPATRTSRIIFTRQQVAELEGEYELSKFAKYVRRKEIAERIGVNEANVGTWFKNRRAKEKRGNTTCRIPSDGVATHSVTKRWSSDDLEEPPPTNKPNVSFIEHLVLYPGSNHWIAV